MLAPLSLLAPEWVWWPGSFPETHCSACWSAPVWELWWERYARAIALRAHREPRPSAAAPAGVVTLLRRPGSALGVRGASASQEQLKDLYDLRIEVRPRKRLDVVAHSLHRPGGSIGTLGAQCIPDIHPGENPRRQRDLQALEPVRIPAAIPPFVMAVWDVERQPQITNGRQHFVCKDRVLPLRP